MIHFSLFSGCLDSEFNAAVAAAATRPSGAHPNGFLQSSAFTSYFRDNLYWTWAIRLPSYWAGYIVSPRMEVDDGDYVSQIAYFMRELGLTIHR